MGEWKNTATKFAVTSSDVYANGRIKYYPNEQGEWEIGSVDFFEERGAFRRGGFEKAAEWFPSLTTVRNPAKDVTTYNPITGQYVTKLGYDVTYDEPPRGERKAYNTESGTAKGRRRAMAKLFDYVRCNWDLDCMFTLTFDAEIIDRESYAEIVRKVGEWFSNRVRRNGLKYIAVPEYHADGKAIHLHGVCNFDALQTKYSRVVQNGKGVYNITDFPFGFTAVKKIGGGENDRHAVAVYVAKYITKDSEKVGGRYYLHGGALVKPREVLCEITAADVETLTKNFSCSKWECPTPIGGRYVKYEVQHFAPAEK